MLYEIQHWIATIKRRLTPRIRAHNAWQIDFKRAIPIQVFSIQLFRQRLSHKSVKAYATMPIGIMGRKSLALID